MGRKIFVTYPEEIKEEEKEETKLFAKRVWLRSPLDLTQIEIDLKNLISMFESLEKSSTNYKIDEAKLTVGWTKDEKGQLHATVSASLINLIKGSIGREISEGISENRLFEVRIKRSP